MISSVEFFWSKYSMHFSFPHTYCMSRPSYHSRFKYPNSVRWRVLIVKNNTICTSSRLKQEIQLHVVDWKSFLHFTSYDLLHNSLLIRNVGNVKTLLHIGVGNYSFMWCHKTVGDTQRSYNRNCRVEFIYRLAAGCAFFCTVLVFHRNTRLLFLFLSSCKWNNMHSVTKWCSLIATVFYPLSLSRDLTMHHYPNVGVSEKDR